MSKLSLLAQKKSNTHPHPPLDSGGSDPGAIPTRGPIQPQMQIPNPTKCFTYNSYDVYPCEVLDPNLLYLWTWEHGYPVRRWHRCFSTSSSSEGYFWSDSVDV
jgi:hypothetical protein